MTKNKEKQLGEALIKAFIIAHEALYLADAYSGGESETVQQLTKQLERIKRQAEAALDQ